MSVTIEQPYKIFTGLDSNPLDGGYIYIGTSGMNPETNPISIYWDSAMTIVADQPLRTSMGFIVRNGSPANVYVAGDYSITVKTSTGILVYSTLSWTLGNDIASAIHSATNKATPIDADEFGLWDSVTNSLNHVTWANIKATLAALTSTWAISTTGNAATATTSTNVSVSDALADTTTWPLLAGTQTGSQTPLTDAGITYNSSTNALTTVTFIGNLSGGDVSGTSGTIAGNTAGNVFTVTNTGSGAAIIANTSTGITGIGLSGVDGNNFSPAFAGVYGSTFLGYGVRGYASSSGVGVYGVSVAGYGVVAEGDTTTPAKSAFRIVPQDAAPTGANQVGDIYVTTAGVLRICTVAGTPGTWTTVGTQV